jgi:hypothetical protein
MGRRIDSWTYKVRKAGITNDIALMTMHPLMGSQHQGGWEEGGLVNHEIIRFNAPQWFAINQIATIWRCHVERIGGLIRASPRLLWNVRSSIRQKGVGLTISPKDRRGVVHEKPEKKKIKKNVGDLGEGFFLHSHDCYVMIY